MTVAADTRAAVREHPFLHTALRAGVVNYTAAARFLDCGDEEAVVAALRRYADELDAYEPRTRRVSVAMHSGVAAVEEPATDDALVVVGETAFVPDGGASTAIVATGEVDAESLGSVLGRLRTADVGVEAAAGADGTLTVVVPRRDSPDAIRAVEDAL